MDLSRPYVREDGALSGLAVVSHKAEGISHQSKFATTDGLAVGHVLFLPVSLQLPSLPTTALHVSTIRSLPPAFVSRFVWSGGLMCLRFSHSHTNSLSLFLTLSLSLPLHCAKELRATILAPLSVIPEYQRQGVGSKLCSWAIELQKSQLVDVIFVLGSSYYRRFGFEPVAQYDVHYVDPALDEHFYCLPLTPGCLEAWRGARVQLPAQFDSLEHSVSIPAHITDSSIASKPLVLAHPNIHAAIARAKSWPQQQQQEKEKETEEEEKDKNKTENRKRKRNRKI